VKRALALLLILSACAPANPGGPPEVAYGKTECSHCGMIVSEDRYAAGYVADDGSTYVVDDLGELFDALKKTPSMRARSWARDLKGGGWVKLDSARLVHIDGHPTPMGTGWVAFKNAEDAKAFEAARSGK
jgi:copper chaperone NosL